MYPDVDDMAVTSIEEGTKEQCTMTKYDLLLSHVYSGGNVGILRGNHVLSQDMHIQRCIHSKVLGQRGQGSVEIRGPRLMLALQ